MPLFVHGYLIMVEGEREAFKANMATHLKDLIGDTERYGLDRVKAYHASWKNQLEQSKVTWENEEVKLCFRHALVWHPATTVIPVAPTSPQPLQKNQSWEGYPFNVLAKPAPRLAIPSTKATALVAQHTSAHIA